MTDQELILKLGEALALTKQDAIRLGAVYGNQSNCMKALQAYLQYRKAHGLTGYKIDGIE